jgi:DNA replication factor GINS
MDPKALRELHRKERKSPYLQELGEDFYPRLKVRLRECYDGYMESLQRRDTARSTRFLTELENLRTTIRDLYEMRERKIVTNALYYVKSGGEVKVQNLSPEEKELFEQIVQALEGQRKTVLLETISETPSHEGLPETQLPEEREDPEEKKTAHLPPSEEREGGEEKAPSLATIRILKPLPSIVGVDGRVYGPFKEEDVITLPEENAQAFVNQEVAERISIEIPEPKSI